MSKVSLGQQIEEIERELGLRERVYPRQVAAGKMRAAEAEFCTSRMQAALASLRWLQANESTIRAAVAAKKAEAIV